MAIFPQTKADGTQYLPLIEGYDEGVIENVRRNTAEASDTQIRDLWMGATKYYLECDFNVSPTNGGTLISFKDLNRESAVTFYSYDELLRYFSENIGTGDGANLTFTIAAKVVTSQQVAVNGVTKTAGTHYNISAGTGALGEDQVVFTAGNAPANGHAVVTTYNGRHKYDVDMRVLTWRTLANGRKVIHLRVEEAL